MDDDDQETKDEEPTMLELKNLLRRAYVRHPELRLFVADPDLRDRFYDAEPHPYQKHSRLKS